ncbi:hypothetical protein ACW9IK_01585 [Pseudomonas gingeri]
MIGSIFGKKEALLVLKVLEVEEASRFFCAMFIGLLTCVRQGSMSLVEAEDLLFAPRIAQVLKRKGVSSEIYNFL